MFDCLAVPGVGHLQVAARGLDYRRVGVLSRRLLQRVEHLEVLTVVGDRKVQGSPSARRVVVNQHHSPIAQRHLSKTRVLL